MNINYTLTHRCETLRLRHNPGDIGSSSTFQAGPFVVYTIDSIQNDAPEARPFVFEARRLRINSSPASVVVSAAEDGRVTTIEPGTTWTTGGLVIIRLEPRDSPLPSPQSGLIYDEHSGDPPVLIIGRPASLIDTPRCDLQELPSLARLP